MKRKGIKWNKNWQGAHQSLQRWFGDLPVVEATHELRVQPTDADIKSAKKNDPANCAFSRTCQRMWGATTVLFFGTVAYVDLLSDKGVRRVERFQLPMAAREYIAAFDAGKKVNPAGFVITPPKPSQTLAGKAAGDRAMLERKRAALLKGRVYVPSRQHSKAGKVSVAHARTIRLSVFRNGKGMVHFTPWGVRA